MNLSTKINHFLLPFFLFILSFGLRTYRLHTPLADWHSWRQADTASVAWQYAHKGIDLLHPTYHDLSSIPSGKDNPQGYRFVEFPFLNALHALLYTHFPQVGFVEWGRLISITFSSLAVIVFYFLNLRLFNVSTAFFGSLFMAVFPYNIYYGRVILPEPSLIFFALFALLSFIIFLDKNKFIFYFLSLLSFTLALLLKPTAYIFALPAGLYFLYHWPYLSRRQRIFSLLFIVFASLPLLWWRHWMQQFPQGIPANRWLFNGNGIRFKGAFFHWLFGERIAKLILGYWGLILVGVGLFKLHLRTASFAFASGLVLGALAYLIIIATGNVQHDYYQIQIIPALAILFGLGADFFLSLSHTFLSKIYTLSLLIFIFLLATALSWYEVRGYFNINNPAIVQAGAKVAQITPPDALVIAPYMGDTAFLFQTHRRGWPIGGDVDAKIKQGASYYVTVAKDKEYHQLLQKYPLVFENEQFAIIKLATFSATH